MKSIEFTKSYTAPSRVDQVNGHCQVFVDVYVPSVVSEAEELSPSRSLVIAMTSLIVIVVLSFCCYDRLIQKRNSMVVEAANRSTAIVDSLFPSNVRDRILEDRAVTKARKKRDTLKGFLFGVEKSVFEAKTEEGGYKTKPIADLFPQTTILFGDIVGFTAWSSVREPSQVFELLETVYHAFDEIAERRRIFKVETIGKVS